MVKDGEDSHGLKTTKLKISAKLFKPFNREVASLNQNFTSTSTCKKINQSLLQCQILARLPTRNHISASLKSLNTMLYVAILFIWFDSILKSRFQQVVCDGCRSQPTAAYGFGGLPRYSFAILLQQTIRWYKIRHAGGQAHYYSRTGTLKQRPQPVRLDWPLF